MVRAYHFVGATLRDGEPVPADGEWIEMDGEPVLCERGFHASKCPWDALQYAPGETLCLVDVDGVVIEGSDKICGTRRRIVARFDATDMLWDQARQSALSVVHLWDAPAVVREYLTTGDESKRAAARDAAWAAARAAAWAAAWAAAGGAARGAAWTAARERFRDAVEAKFAELVP